MIEFAAAFVAGHCALNRSDAPDGRETMRATVGVVALQLASLEWKRMKRLLARDAQINTSDLPLDAVRIDVTTSTAFESNEMCEFVLQRAP